MSSQTKNLALIYKEAPHWRPRRRRASRSRRCWLRLCHSAQGRISPRTLHASFDPYMRGRMRSPKIKSYSLPFELNKPILSHGIACVLKSDAGGYHEGDIIAGPHFHRGILSQGYRAQYPHSQSRYRNWRAGRQAISAHSACLV